MAANYISSLSLSNANSSRLTPHDYLESFRTDVAKITHKKTTGPKDWYPLKKNVFDHQEPERAALIQTIFMDPDKFRRIKKQFDNANQRMEQHLKIHGKQEKISPSSKNLNPQDPEEAKAELLNYAKAELRPSAPMSFFRSHTRSVPSFKLGPEDSTSVSNGTSESPSPLLKLERYDSLLVESPTLRGSPVNRGSLGELPRLTLSPSASKHIRIKKKCKSIQLSPVKTANDKQIEFDWSPQTTVVRKPPSLNQVFSPKKPSEYENPGQMNGWNGIDLKPSARSSKNNGKAFDKVQFSRLYQTLLRPEGFCQRPAVLKKPLQSPISLKRENSPRSIMILDESALPDLQSARLVGAVSTKDINIESVRDIPTIRESNALYNNTARTHLRSLSMKNLHQPYLV